MTQTNIVGSLLNLIVYIILSIPSLILCFRKKNFETKKSFYKSISISFFLETMLFTLSLVFAKELFNIFPVSNGIKNYAQYAQKILFITTPFVGFKFLMITYMYRKEQKKEATTLIISKIVAHISIAFGVYNSYDFKKILYSYSIIDFFFILTFLLLFHRIRKPRR